MGIFQPSGQSFRWQNPPHFDSLHPEAFIPKICPFSAPSLPSSWERPVFVASSSSSCCFCALGDGRPRRRRSKSLLPRWRRSALGGGQARAVEDGRGWEGGLRWLVLAVGWVNQPTTMAGGAKPDGGRGGKAATDGRRTAPGGGGEAQSMRRTGNRAWALRRALLLSSFGEVGVGAAAGGGPSHRVVLARRQRPTAARPSSIHQQQQGGSRGCLG